MINTSFKIQPVAAFYRLFGKSFLFIFSVSIFLSLFGFLLLKISLVNSLGAEGLKELSQFVEKPSANMVEQSKAMQKFLSKYPNVVSVMFGALVLMLLFFSYLFYTSQMFIKNKSFGPGKQLFSILIPGRECLTILIYLILSTGYFIFASGFIVVGISANPVIGIIAAIFIGMLLIRTLLFIPGVVIGEMNFSDSLKYSFQTISSGRAFKIIIFGTLIFIVISLVIQALVYFPSLWFSSNSSKMFINILVLFLQTGCISVGTTALFLRYGDFEEEKIA